MPHPNRLSTQLAEAMNCAQARCADSRFVRSVKFYLEPSGNGVVDILVLAHDRLGLALALRWFYQELYRTAPELIGRARLERSPTGVRGALARRMTFTLTSGEPPKRRNRTAGASLLTMAQIAVAVLTIAGSAYPLGLLVLHRQLALLRGFSDSTAWYAASLPPVAIAINTGLQFARGPLVVALAITAGASAVLLFSPWYLLAWLEAKIEIPIPALQGSHATFWNAIDQVVNNPVYKLFSITVALCGYASPFVGLVLLHHFSISDAVFYAAVMFLVCTVLIGLTWSLRYSTPHDAIRPLHPNFRYYIKRFQVAGVAFVLLYAVIGFVSIVVFDLKYVPFWAKLLPISVVSYGLILTVHGKEYHFSRAYGRIWLALTLAEGCSVLYVGASGFAGQKVFPGLTWTLYLAGAFAGLACYCLWSWTQGRPADAAWIVVAALFSYFPAYLPAYWTDVRQVSPASLEFPIVTLCQGRSAVASGELLGLSGAHWYLIVPRTVTSGKTGKPGISYTLNAIPDNPTIRMEVGEAVNRGKLRCGSARRSGA
jgi:hypothetical protein